MKNKVVLLELKESGETFVFKTVVELMRAKGDEVGITLNALWNALARTDGNYENKRCRVSYHQL